jgi:uncharacterized protein with NRDE domain
MCLLVVLSRMSAEAPLVVAANRDERYDRPAVSMTVLREVDPRIVGGQDKVAGGTWLGINEHGVVAGLTNRPMGGARDPSKRSRGQIPLELTAYRSAAQAVTSFEHELVPEDFNPCWVLVGDRRALFYADMTGGSRARVQELGPGVHILENRPLGTASVKVDHVRERLQRGQNLVGEELIELLGSILADHRRPEAAVHDGGDGRPAELSASCVHTDGYGTTSATIVAVPVATPQPPGLWVADGPPCMAPIKETSDLFS